MKTFLALSVALLLGACAQDEDVVPSSSGLTVHQHDGSTLDVTYTSAGASLHMTSIATSASVADVTFDFGTHVIAFHLDYGVGEGDFITDGKAFDAIDIHLAQGLLAALPSILPADPSQYSQVETAAVRQTNGLTEAPTGEIVQAFHFVSERGWDYIGCGCGNQFIGNNTYRTAGVGCGCTGGSGNGCKGRCGAGCTGEGGYPSYTRDCARHDYGLVSWTTASDDYAFAGANCWYVSGCT